MKTIALFASFLMFLAAVNGCGNGQNPVSTGSVETVDASGGTELQIINAIPAAAGKAADISLEDTEEGNDLEISLSHSVDRDGVLVTITADEGHLISRDVVKMYSDDGRDEEYLGRVRIPTGSYYESIDILIEADDLPSDNDVTIIVHIERDGDLIADEEFEVGSSSDVSLEAEVTDADEITLFFDDDVEVDSRRRALRNITLTRDGEEVDIDDVDEESRGEIIIITERDLEDGDYTVEYNGDGGLEADDEPVDSFSLNFEVDLGTEDEGEEEDTGDNGEEDNDSDEEGDNEDSEDNDNGEESSETDTDNEDDGNVWMTVRTGILGNDGSTVFGMLITAGIEVTPWAQECLTGPSWNVGEEGIEIDLYILTDEDLGLSGSYSIGQVKEAVLAAGYSFVPVESAVLARFLHRNQDANEHLLFVSDYLTHEDRDHLLVVTGQAYAKPAGDWLAAHRFSGGDTSNVVEGHSFVVTK